MFNVGNITRENNPRGHTRYAARPSFDTWTMIAAYARGPASGIRIRTFLAVSAGFLADRLIVVPRRLRDRLFAINDAEAGWRGWQVTSVRGGFARRYRDLMFDTLNA